MPAPVLEGTVVDPEGCGVEGVTVSANFLRRHSSGYNHYLGYATSRTDACGRLEVQVPGSAEWVTLWFDAPGWVQPAARTVSPGGTTLGDGTPADARALGLVRRDGWPRQRIVLERGAPIEGVVETPAGVPVPDARVEATWHGGCAETRTDGSGRFSIAVPAAAILVARAHRGDLVTPAGRPPFPPFDATEPRFERILTEDAEGCAGPVPPGSSGVRILLCATVPLRLRLEGPEGPVTGHVTVEMKALTQPAPAFVLELYVRDGEFQYEIPRVMPGRYEIEVVPDEAWVPARVLATLPGDPIDVRFPQGLSIEGLLEGEDLKNFKITWTGPCNEGFGMRWTETAEFVLEGLGDGTGDVYARREGDPRCALVTRCRPGRRVLRLTLSEGRSIGGRAEVPEGLDPSALDVRAVRGPLDQHARVRPDGTFSIVGLPPGAFRVELVTRRWSRGGLVARWLHDARDGVETGTDDVVLRVRLPATEPMGDDP